MQQLAELPQTWTYADLQRLLPEDADRRRYEIVDGALVVNPSASRRHEVISARLLVAIHSALPAGCDVVGPFGLDIAPSYRMPDLMVLPTTPRAGAPDIALPHEVLLAVEVVSPSSRLTDRIAKPAQYAAAGIPGYWRVETDPEVTLTAYALDPGAAAYTELGSWGRSQTATIERPFPARITIDDLIP